MGTITQRKRKDGTTAWRAEVRIMREGVQVFKAIKTFDSRQHAKTWAHTVEAEYRDHEDSARPRHTVGEVIGLYLDRMASLKPLGRTRRLVLESVRRGDLAGVVAADLSERDLVRFCEQRRAGGAGPATTLVDYSALRTMFSEAKPLLGIDVNADAFRVARPLLVKLGLIGKPKARNRRPRSDELDRLLAHFRKRATHSSAFIPMADIVEFAVYSCMRQGEICRATWADLDEGRRTLTILDRKAPSGKIGNDQTIPLLGPAFEIASRQPRLSDRIFPFDERSVSAAFTRTCAQLGIEGLRFHDLRREGATRLMEMGYSVPEVATVTGHRDLNILWRVYTSISPEHMHGKYVRK